MPADWQTPAVIATVALAAGWLLASAWRKRRRAARGCGGDCGCPTSKTTLRPNRR